jgi:hypothetical protein
MGETLNPKPGQTGIVQCCIIYIYYLQNNNNNNNNNNWEKIAMT